MNETPKLTRADIEAVRGRELHILKNPESHTAADALARGTWPEVSALIGALEADAGRRRTEAN